MTRRPARRLARAAAVALGIAVACTPARLSSQSTAPSNSCPDYPCAAYSQDGGAACAAGTCIDPAPPPVRSHLVLLVAVPNDAHIAPGVTFALSPDVAPDAGVTFLESSLNLGRYLATLDTVANLQASTGVHFSDTSLPVHATYRPLWSPGSASPAPALDAGLPLTDAVAAGLALYPVQVDAVPVPNGVFASPFGGPDVGFAAYVQAGITYERTLAPDPPWDQTFPPDVNRVAFPTGQAPENQGQDEYAPDLTRKTELTATIPTFDLSRADGQSLDGWTAYLRDATTKRPLSPIKPLSGTSTPDGGLVLPTSHHPVPVDDSPPDALTNAELVMAPPAVENLPTAAFPAVAILPRRETYPFVPNPVTVRGSVAWVDRNPVLADVAFEATGIYALAPMPEVSPIDAGEAGLGGLGEGDAGLPFPLQTQGFEYVAHATAQPDVEGTTSTYSIVLPRGAYRISVRPLDAPASPGDAGRTTHALTVVDAFDTGQSDDPIPGPSVAVQLAPIAFGTAVVADGRPLSGATVEALPVHCARSAGDAGVGPVPDSPACMPRYALGQTSDPDGSFALALDPGIYTIRVEPTDGTRLPWVSELVSVPTSDPIGFRIPAPVHRGMQLFGQDGIAITNAIVRMFTMPPAGPAIELGRAVTDASGRFDLYIDPAEQ